MSMEARLVRATGKTKEACKALQVDRFFNATRKVLQALSLNFSADQGAKKFRYNMSSDGHESDFRVTIKVTPHFVIINTSWSKAVPEPHRAAATVFCMAFNNQLTHSWSKADIDQRDGEFRLSTSLPVGVFAEEPEGMLKFYIQTANVGAEVVLAGVSGVAKGEERDPLRHGDATATLLNMIMKLKLASN